MHKPVETYETMLVINTHNLLHHICNEGLWISNSIYFSAADKKGKSAMLHFGESQPEGGDLRQTRMEIRDMIKVVILLVKGAFAL